MNTYYLTTVVLVVMFSVSANATIHGAESMDTDLTMEPADREAGEIESAGSPAAENIPDLQEARFGVSAEMVERLIRRPSEGDHFQEPYAEEEDVSGRLREFFSRATSAHFEAPGSSLDYDGYTISVVQTPRNLDRIRNVFRRIHTVRSVIDPPDQFDVRIRISGEVQKPGVIEYFSPPSLGRVLEDTGGITRLARRVYILRSGGDELELIGLSRRDLQNPEIADPLLQDCDWIHAISPDVAPWPNEWPRRSTSDPSGLDQADRSRLPDPWKEPNR